MPAKRRKEKSKCKGTGGSDDVTDSNTGDLDNYSIASNGGSDGAESGVSNCSHQTADDVLFRQTPNFIVQLNMNLEHLTEKISKSRPQSRIVALQSICKILQFNYCSDILFDEWESGITALVEILSRIVKSGAKEDITVLSLQCLSVLCVQVCNMTLVTEWLTTNGWQDDLLNIIQIKGGAGGNVATSPAVRAAAIQTLATLHFVSDYENKLDLKRCMDVMECIYHSSSSTNKATSNRTSSPAELQSAALDNWCLLFCFLSPMQMHSEGQKQIGILYKLLCSNETPSQVKISAGQALALVCERLRVLGHSQTALLAISTVDSNGGNDERYDILMNHLKVLAHISEKSISKEMRKAMRVCFRRVRESIERDLGRRSRNETLTEDMIINQCLITNHSDEDEGEEEEESDSNYTEDDDDAGNYLNSRGSSRKLHLQLTSNVGGAIDRRWGDCQYEVLNMGSVKLPLTGEIVSLTDWMQKRYYDSLSLTLRGGLQQHMQFNPIVREIFKLPDHPKGIFSSFQQSTTAGGGGGGGGSEGPAKDNKNQRRAQLELGKKQSKQQRQKQRSVREQRLGQRPSMSED